MVSSIVNAEHLQPIIAFELEIQDGWTVLHEAAARGSTAMVQYLISLPEFHRMLNERSVRLFSSQT
jgi:ankyrin repeat protein